MKRPVTLPQWFLFWCDNWIGTLNEYNLLLEYDEHTIYMVHNDSDNDMLFVKLWDDFIRQPTL